MANIFDGLNDEVRFAFKSNASNAPTFDVVSFEGEEGVSRLFRFEITLVTTSQEIDLNSLLTSTVTFATRATNGSVYAPYHGILCEVELLGQVDQYMFCRVVLVPAIWKI
jgi:type VI secretion system secreted protein VgrG